MREALTSEALANLKILRDWAADGNITQKSFDMRHYRIAKKVPTGKRAEVVNFYSETDCGTVGCLLGNTPFVPAFKDQVEKSKVGGISPVVSFKKLTEILFGFPYYSSYPETPNHIWFFLFSSDWASTGEPFDNTVEAAIMRMDIVLDGLVNP